jgi:hypothetical protein
VGILNDADTGDELIPLTSLSKPGDLDARLRALIPKRDGKLPHVSVWFRYCTRGIRGIRLEVLRAGGRLCTTRGAILRFYARLSGLGDLAAVNSRAVRREAAAADKLLDAAGL